MKDWKGNEIKAGDTIVFVLTKPMFTNFGMMIPLEGGGFEFHKSKNQPPEHCWEPLEYETKEMDGKLYYGGRKDANGYTMWFQFDDTGFLLQPSTIVCIKGVSDNEEEYYKEYFKVN